MVYDLFYRLTTKWIETECTKKRLSPSSNSVGLNPKCAAKNQKKVKNLRGYGIPVVRPPILVGIYNITARLSSDVQL